MGFEFTSSSSGKRTFEINGKEFSVEDVPEEFKDILKDEDNDGKPDVMEEIFEGGPISAVKGIAKVIKASKNLPTSMKQQKSYQPTSGVETPSVWRKLATIILIAGLVYLALSFLK